MRVVQNKIYNNNVGTENFKILFKIPLMTKLYTLSIDYRVANCMTLKLNTKTQQ